ncbi:hypothetical protein T02_1839 [Trichinella nativa]|uniref:Uncharacterized protein n=1 Tax=Trichinella nativa TaxID=6335 RepID=A0A0V1IDH0_9BILA|nr:hypothetical protein T02_1839 [Trichinella nativa]
MNSDNVSRRYHLSRKSNERRSAGNRFLCIETSY